MFTMKVLKMNQITFSEKESELILKKKVEFCASFLKKTKIKKK